jgi:PAS domain S-box-containing protein
VEARDRDSRWYSVSVLPYRTRDNRIEGAVIAYFDISEQVNDRRKIADYASDLEEMVEERTSEIKETKERLEAFTDSAPDLLYIYDSQLNLIDVNRAGLGIFPEGTAKEDVIGRNIQDLVPEFEKTERYELYLETIRTGITRSIDNVPSLLGKEERLFDLKIFRVGEGLGVMATDVTERNIAEKELYAASLYARSLIEASLDPLVTISPEGKITDVNEATVQVTGASRESLIGSDFSDYFTEPDKARDGYRHVFTEGTVRDYPLAIRHASGKVTDVTYNATVYKNEAGEVQGVFAAARDITEKKRTEERLLQAERMEAVSKMSAMMAHDLRGPLSTVNQAVEMIRRSPERADRMLKMIGDNTNRALNMIEEIRTGTREIQPHIERTDLVALIRTISEETKMPRAVKVELAIGGGLDAVMLDPGIVRRTLENLLLNATDAMPDGGTITLRARKEDEQICIEVSDTGIGISDEMLPHMFETFYSTKSKGLGFGLPYCQRAVEALGGTITFTTKRGEGTTFTINLPCKRA